MNLQFGLLALFAAVSASQAASSSFNEHIEQYAADKGFMVDVVLGIAHNGSELGNSLVRRASDWPTRYPELKIAIDKAVKKTAARVHFFWSGRVFPATSDDDSVMDRALEIARPKGGTTLEGTLEGVTMPDFGAGAIPDAEDIWQYASDAYAAESRGDVYFVRGESLRSGNVWEVYEYPRLKKMPAVKRIFEIKYHRTGPEPQRQIWPELEGCDGVKFLEQTVQCPTAAPLYYGSPHKPVVTAKTSVAKDAKIKFSPSGNSPGVVRECTEIMRTEWVMEVFREAGVCEAATAKGDGGKAMTKVKALLSSANNRNYIQRERLAKMKAKLIGVPLMGPLKWALVDSLVAIDYYERTAAASAAMTEQIDSLVSAAAGKSPGLAAAWREKISTQKATKAALLAELQRQIAQKVKEAAEAAARAGACGAPPTPGKASTSVPTKRGRMVRRWTSLRVSPVELGSFQTRTPTAHRSGSKAAPAPSCPLKGAPGKTVVPRSQVQTRPRPTTTPRVPVQQPIPRPAMNKRVVPRPADRPRRSPGKPASGKRITPKRQPTVVPKPTRRPTGRPRTRRNRNK